MRWMKGAEGKWGEWTHLQRLTEETTPGQKTPRGYLERQKRDVRLSDRTCDGSFLLCSTLHVTIINLLVKLFKQALTGFNTSLTQFYHVLTH